MTELWPTKERGSNYLKVRLLEDVGELHSGGVFFSQLIERVQDLGDQLNVVISHRLQLDLLQPLVSLRMPTQNGHIRYPSHPRTFCTKYLLKKKYNKIQNAPSATILTNIKIKFCSRSKFL